MTYKEMQSHPKNGNFCPKVVIMLAFAFRRHFAFSPPIAAVSPPFRRGEAGKFSGETRTFRRFGGELALSFFRRLSSFRRSFAANFTYLHRFSPFFTERKRN